VAASFHAFSAAGDNMGRRITIKQLKAEINQTALMTQQKLDQAGHLMTEGEKAMAAIVAQLMKLMASTLDLVEDVQDGKARVVLQVGAKDWPIGARLDFLDDKPATPPTPQP
jgi:hypothetical protein